MSLAKKIECVLIVLMGKLSEILSLFESTPYLVPVIVPKLQAVMGAIALLTREYDKDPSLFDVAGDEEGLYDNGRRAFLTTLQSIGTFDDDAEWLAAAESFSDTASDGPQTPDEDDEYISLEQAMNEGIDRDILGDFGF